MQLQIVHYGDPILLTQGEPVTQFDEDLKALFKEMVEAMREAEGIGLAAQQIGEALQFCVVDLSAAEPDFEYTLDGAKPPMDFFMPIGMCNPRIEILDPAETTYEEGCLSFPDIRGDIDRPDWIRCQYQDIDGAPHVIECDGLLSRCIQHEVDHLNGVLFIDRMKKRVFKKIQVQVNELKSRTQRRARR